MTDVVLLATPLAGPVTASETPHPLLVQATDSAGNTLPSPAAFVTWSSDEPTDQFTDAGVIMTKEGNHTITASWSGDTALSSSFDVSVAPGPLVGLAILDTPTTATPGATITIGVAGVDAFGNLFGDASSVATFISNVSSDVFASTPPNEVTLTALGEHVITASYPGYNSGSITITVVPAPASEPVTPPTDGGAQPDATSGNPPGPGHPGGNVHRRAGQLAVTGADAPISALIFGIAATAAGGIALLLARRRRTTRNIEL